jgi:hypothetical protein
MGARIVRVVRQSGLAGADRIVDAPLEIGAARRQERRAGALERRRRRRVDECGPHRFAIAEEQQGLDPFGPQREVALGRVARRLRQSRRGRPVRKRAKDDQTRRVPFPGARRDRLGAL